MSSGTWNYSTDNGGLTNRQAALLASSTFYAGHSVSSGVVLRTAKEFEKWLDRPYGAENP